MDTPFRRIKPSLLAISSLLAIVLAATPGARAQTGTIGADTPTGLAGGFGGTIETGAGTIDPHELNASRSVTDLVVPGAVVPFTYTRIWNSRHPGYAVANENNWSESAGTNWSWAIEAWESTLQGDNVPTGNDWWHGYKITFPDGKTIQLGKTQAGGAPGAPGMYVGTAAVPEYLVIDNDGLHLHLHLGDGGVVNWISPEAGSEGLDLILDSIVDPYGRVVRFSYDATGMTITEPGQRWIKVGAAVSANNGNTQTTVVSTSLGQSITYIANFGGTSGSSASITYNDVADPATGQPIQAYYTYEHVQPPKTGQDASNPSVPMPPAFNRLAWASDPMFAGPVSQVKHVYVNNGNLDPTLTAILEERYAPDASAAGVLLTRIDPGAYNYPSSGSDEAYSTRTETRGDGTKRTISYFNPTVTYQYYDTSTSSLKTGVGRGQNRIDHVTDYTNNPNQIERHEYAANNPFPIANIVTDMRGKVTQLTIEPVLGHVTRQTYPGGAHKDWTYTDPAQPYYVATVTDERGYTTTYTRDTGTHLIRRIDYPDGGYETFDYDPYGFGLVTDHRLATGGVEHSDYDGRGLKTLSWPAPTASDPNPWDHPTHYYYYANNVPYKNDRLYAITDPRGNVTYYDYNARGQTTIVTHGDGSYTANVYDIWTGTLTSAADELGHTTNYTYDEYKRVLTVTNAMNEPTTNNYALDWVNPLAHTTNNVKYTLSPSGKNVVFDYDANFRKVAQTVAAGTDEAATTTFGYDAVGNLISTTDPRNKTTTFGYDDRNRQTSATNALQQTTTTTYDDAGNKLTVTRPNNPPIQFTGYDQMNRLTEQIDERGAYSWLGYDHAGDVTDRWDGNNNHYQYIFDEQKRLTKTIYPDNSTEERGYDTAGNVAWNKSRTGAVQTYAPYDNRNRPASFSWSDGTQWQSWAYDAASHVTQVSNAEAEVYFDYDAANRKTAETETIKSYGLYASRGTVYKYEDQDGNRTRINYPEGYQFTYEYTVRNQLGNIRLDPAIFGGQYQTPVMHYEYDLSGNRTNRTAISGAWAEYGIDDVNRIANQTNHFANGVQSRYDYGFDQLGRRRYEQRDSGKADGFQFDPSDEITAYQREGTLNGDGTVSADWMNPARTIGYDNNGNRNGYGANNLNQYTSDGNGGSLGYDWNGNLTTASGWTYTYDAQNRLVRLEGWNNSIGQWEVIVQTYDGLNRVVTRSVNGDLTQNVWDGWNLIAEHRGDWSVKRCYLYGANQNELVGAFDGGEYPATTYWQDGRGNTGQVTGDDAVLLEKYTYNLEGQPSFYWPSWGEYDMGSSQFGVQFLFAGSQYLPETGLYDMRNRVYNPGLNRFMQTDPIGFQGDPINLYRYCHNDDADNSDPIGLMINAGPADEVRPPVEVRTQEIREEVTGSRIPQVVGTQTTFSGSADGVRAAATALIGQGGSFSIGQTSFTSSGNLNGIPTFPSWQDAGKAGAALAAGQSATDHQEHYGDIGQSDRNSSKYTYGRMHTGGEGSLDDGRHRSGYYNQSPVNGPVDLPGGFTKVGFYWSLAYHQNGWPQGDRLALWTAKMNGVLAFPPSRGASPASARTTFLTYEYVPDSLPPEPYPH